MASLIRQWSCSVAVLAAISGGPIAQAQEEISAALRDRVAQLVEQLEHGEAAQQDRAEEALVKLGPRVLSLLPREAEADDLAQRLARIQAALEAGSGSEDLGASLVTIQGKGLRLSEILRELQRQTSNRLSDLREIYGQEAGNPALDLDIVDTPFLEALDLVADRAGLSLVFFTGDGTIGLLAGGELATEMEQSDGEAPTVYNGPFRVTLNQIAAQHDLTTGTRSANAQLLVVWEPRLRPMLMRLDVTDLEIIDDRGEPVPPTVSEESATVALRPDTPAAELNLNMIAPDRQAQSLAHLKAKATLTVPAANQVFRLDLAEENPRQERGEVSVAVGRVDVEGFVWKINVEVAYDGNSEAFESYRQGLFNNRIWLQRPDGSRFEQNGGFNQIGGSAGSMVFQYLFVDAPGEPADYQLVYETPGTIAEIPLKFEFKDVPLP